MPLFRRLRIAKEIFTKEELWELTKFEISRLFRKEWIFYFLTFLIWFLFFRIVFITYENSKAIEIKETTTPVKIVIEQKNIYQPIMEEIEKKSTSSTSSSEIFEKVFNKAKEENLDFCLILAIIEKESNFNEKVKAKDYSRTQSIGWSQATKAAWDTFNAQYVWEKYKTVYSLKDKENIDKSLEFICWQIKWLTKNNKQINSPLKLYVAYNGGINAVSKSGEILNAEALRNAKKFVQIYNKYLEAYTTK